jgi:hypothetical protein
MIAREGQGSGAYERGDDRESYGRVTVEGGPSAERRRGRTGESKGKGRGSGTGRDGTEGGVFCWRKGLEVGENGGSDSRFV